MAAIVDIVVQWSGRLVQPHFSRLDGSFLIWRVYTFAQHLLGGGFKSGCIVVT